MGKDFWPKETDDTFYIEGNCNLSDIQTRITEKWPGVNPDAISITPEYIHIQCLGYDLYDPSDYTSFLVVRLTKT